MWLMALGVEASAFEEVFNVSGNHDSHLVVPQRDAGQETSRTIHARVGFDSCAVGRTAHGIECFWQCGST